MKKTIWAVVLFAVLLSLSLIPLPANALRLKPGTERLREDFYADPSSAWAAFEAGLADIYAFGLSADQIAAARADTNIQLAYYEESGQFEFDLNNNITIAEQPGYRSPTSDASFRRALAHLADKDYICDVILEGFGGRMDVPLPVPLAKGYFDPAGIDPGKYPYVFSLAKARDELVANRFVEGSTGPLVTGGDNVRTYPTGWPHAGEDLQPIIIYARSDSPPRFAAAEMLRDEMLMVGIPVDFRPYTFAGVYGPVFTDKNYHIYTGGWGLGRFPTFLWFLYHSDWWKVGVPWPNYVTGKYADGTPVHPLLDTYLDGIWYATTVSGMRDSVQEACEYMFNNSVTIPLWSWKSYTAYRKGLLGVVNQDLSGIENDYTLMNCHKRLGDPQTLIMALVTPPVKLNPLYSSDYYGWQVLDRIYDGLMSIAPYNVARDQPWMAQDWESGTWIDPWDGKSKSVNTYWFRKDNYFSDGVEFTAEDYKFSMQYIYAFDDCWMWDSAMDVHHIDIINDYQVEVYMEPHSIWTLYEPTGPMLPMHVWLKDIPGWPLADKVTETVPVDSKGVVQLTEEPVWIESVSGLVEGDYNLYLSPNPEAVLNITKTPFPTTATVTYWAAGSASGYTPADLDWSEILIGSGLYKLLDLSPGAGGFAYFKRNPTRDIPVPPGEVDYYWHWEAGTKPRKGCYKIDIRDVGLMYGAWLTRGDGWDNYPDTPSVGGLPPPEWVPAADIADKRESWCVIDEWDAKRILPHYGAEYGWP